MLTRPRLRRIVAIGLLVVGSVISLLSVLLVIGAYREDAAIEARTGRATAEVISVAVNRTLIRYQTSDGAQHIPPDGVLYPAGLAAGQLVRVEYDRQEPELVRVAGRDANLTLLPVGLVVLITWLVVLPLWWLLRRGIARPVSHTE